ncbi:15072_t:CDS:2 [Entrophospora sp. SA101]|nr:15072_t:CDS:2 [Entrophospora sp. SA101]
MDLYYEQFNFMQLDTQTQNQDSNNGNNIPENSYSQPSSTLLSSSISPQNHNFAQSMANTTFSLSNNMLATPEGSDRNVCVESIIMSPFGMMPNSGSLVVNSHYDNEQLVYCFVPPELLSPITSPILPPDQPIDIHTNNSTRGNQKSRLYNQTINSSRFQSISKPNGHNTNLSQTQGRGTSFFNNNNHNVKSNNNNSNLSSIMAGSPCLMPKNDDSRKIVSPLNNNLINSTQLSIQDSMPNLNLGMNLVSEQSTSPILPLSSLSNNSSSNSNDISPITPSSIMQLKAKQLSSTPSTSTKEQQNDSNNDITINNEKQNLLPKCQNSRSKNQQKDQQSKSEQSINKPTKNIAPPPLSSSLTQMRSVMVTNGDVGPQTMMVISPTTSPISPISSITPGRKIVRNCASPIALGPSIHSKSPQALKPTISPNLKPKLPGVLADEVAEQLAEKSNYRSILEGTAQSLGISYSSDVHSSLESRRTTHKAAEQKRRDSLKKSFDELKKVVPLNLSGNSNDTNSNNNNNSSDSVNVDKNNSKSGENINVTTKNVSKLFLLKRAHDHIVELQRENDEKDDMIKKLQYEVESLKGIKRQKTEEKIEIFENNGDLKTFDREEDKKKEDESSDENNNKTENTDVQDNQSNEKEKTKDPKNE